MGATGVGGANDFANGVCCAYTDKSEPGPADHCLWRLLEHWQPSTHPPTRAYRTMSSVLYRTLLSTCSAHSAYRHASMVTALLCPYVSRLRCQRETSSSCVPTLARPQPQSPSQRVPYKTWETLARVHRHQMRATRTYTYRSRKTTFLAIWHLIHYSCAWAASNSNQSLYFVPQPNDTEVARLSSVDLCVQSFQELTRLILAPLCLCCTHSLVHVYGVIMVDSYVLPFCRTSMLATVMMSL